MTLADQVRDARRRTWEMVDGLEGERLLGPRLAIVNPVLWELGHVAWFQEKWVLRNAAGQLSGRVGADTLYDSDAVPHPSRWDLPLLPLDNVRRWMRETEERVLERLASWPSDAPETYYVRLSVLHEDMHAEAFCYTRQTLGYPAPSFPGPAPSGATVAGDVSFAGGRFLMGGRLDDAFVFDNEKWAHEVEVAPFAMARGAVTEREFSEFVDDGGYSRRELWSDEGWRWRASSSIDAPLYWRREGGTWVRRVFDSERALLPAVAMIHVSWHEAEAFCRWAGRRLPTEAEWELAASSAAPGALDATVLGPVGVGAGNGDGCRQLLGNVWEWTSDRFEPYAGFSPDPYATYSAPYFGTHRVLRGGCWVTRTRIARPQYRNFYMPHRRDVFAGFRTCAP